MGIKCSQRGNKWKPSDINLHIMGNGFDLHHEYDFT